MCKIKRARVVSALSRKFQDRKGVAHRENNFIVSMYRSSTAVAAGVHYMQEKHESADPKVIAQQYTLYTPQHVAQNGQRFSGADICTDT